MRITLRKNNYLYQTRKVSEIQTFIISYTLIVYNIQTLTTWTEEMTIFCYITSQDGATIIGHHITITITLIHLLHNSNLLMNYCSPRQEI